MTIDWPCSESPVRVALSAGRPSDTPCSAFQAGADPAQAQPRPLRHPPSGTEAGGAKMLEGGRERDDGSRDQPPGECQAAQRPPLHGDPAARRREKAELLGEAPLVLHEHRTQLTRYRDPAGGLECLSDL